LAWPYWKQILLRFFQCIHSRSCLAGYLMVQYIGLSDDMQSLHYGNDNDMQKLSTLWVRWPSIHPKSNEHYQIFYQYFQRVGNKYQPYCRESSCSLGKIYCIVCFILHILHENFVFQGVLRLLLQEYINVMFYHVSSVHGPSHLTEEHVAHLRNRLQKRIWTAFFAIQSFVYPIIICLILF